MTDRKDALTELLAKVKAGSEPNTDDVWDSFVESNSFVLSFCLKVLPAYNGSLDAAKALHEAVLPDHRARIDVGKKYRAWIITPDNEKFDAYSPNPARAWLIAILKALIVREVSLERAALGDGA
jgi:hypothetical protein